MDGWVDGWVGGWVIRWMWLMRDLLSDWGDFDGGEREGEG